METMSVVEARRSFSEVMARVAYTGQRVVVARKGRPMMALVSVEDLRRLEELEGEAPSTRTRRAAALALAAAARARIRAERNSVPLPGSADTLDRLREERLHELANLR
ncbi:MAG: prevent-host-death family protein [Chloroflexi bacterium HGW-Chloroflexi-1]|nr:MAG: prevent-host-death family protein [Chloroflexi bacterium HGW-Chloroflexi-1]